MECEINKRSIKNHDSTIVRNVNLKNVLPVMMCGDTTTE